MSPPTTFHLKHPHELINDTQETMWMLQGETMVHQGHRPEDVARPIGSKHSKELLVSVGHPCWKPKAEDPLRRRHVRLLLHKLHLCDVAGHFQLHAADPARCNSSSAERLAQAENLYQTKIEHHITTPRECEKALRCTRSIDTEGEEDV